MTSRGYCRQALALAVVGAVVVTSGCSESTPSDSASAGDTGTVSSATVRRTAEPDDYVSRGSRYPQWGFVTPSSNWMCVIGVYPSGGDQAACAAGLAQGPLPIAGVPFAKSPSGVPTTLAPNVITVSESSDPVFRLVDEPIWGGAGVPRELPYDTVLEAGGFRCNVQRSGVSCRNDISGMGFGFSAKGYQLAYTDVPAR